MALKSSLLAFGLTFGGHAHAESREDVPCLPANIGAQISQILGRSWNQGQGRAFEVRGELWSMPIKLAELESLPKELARKLGSGCLVEAFLDQSFTLRVLPNLSKGEIAAFSATATSDSYLAKDGTTLGALSTTPGEGLLMMYPARLAAAIAGGKGSVQRADLSEVATKFPAQVDLEYNFQNVTVATFVADGAASMAEAANAAFQAIRRLGYTPGPGQERLLGEFDSVFAPAKHESIWLKPNAIARLAIEKQKFGKVRLSIHETKGSSH